MSLGVTAKYPGKLKCRKKVKCQYGSTSKGQKSHQSQGPALGRSVQVLTDPKDQHVFHLNKHCSSNENQDGSLMNIHCVEFCGATKDDNGCRCQ